MAQTKSFSIEEALRFGWGVLEKNFGLILQFIFATLVLYFANYLFARVVGKGTLASLVNWLVGAVVALGWIYVALTFQAGKKPALENLQKALSPVFLNYLLASILYGLVVVAGLVNFLGALAFGIGLVVTIPITLLAGAQIYRQLLSQAKL